MKKLSLIIIFFILIIPSLPAQSDYEMVQVNKNKLLEQGFSSEINREGFAPLVSSFAFEVFLMRSKGIDINFNYYFYDWIEDNILYEVSFLSKEYANNCVVAYILEEGSFERWKETPVPAALITLDNDPRYGQHAGKTYAITEPLYKINENDEPPKIFIP